MNSNKKMGGKLAITGLAAGIFCSVLLLPKARAELVYENPDETQADQVQDTANTRSEERDSMRQALGASEKAQATLQAQQPVQVQVVQPAPQAAPQVMRVVLPSTQAAVETAPAAAASQASAAAEVQNLSKSELLRRQRVREELKNEDLLQERLEELRLQDEKKRTEQLLNGGQPLSESTLNSGAASATPAMKDEVVSVPVTETPGKPTDTRAVVASATAANPQMTQDQISVSSASTVSVADVSDHVAFSIEPWAGLSSMSNSLSYEVRPHYSAGIGLGMGVSNNLSLELGYQYSEYGITASSMNPYVLGYQAWANANSYGPAGGFETQTLRQNIGRAGLKLNFLGPDAKIRPFLAGGAAYSVGYINYSPTAMALLQQYYGQSYNLQDYTLSSFLGYIGAGMDVKVSKSISVGADFRYYSVLSVNENQNLNNMALYSPASYYANADQQLAGGTLAFAGFYSITGGLTFSF